MIIEKSIIETDSRSHSRIYYRFSKWVGYARIGRSKHGAVACFASLLIKLKPLTSVKCMHCIAL